MKSLLAISILLTASIIATIQANDTTTNANRQAKNTTIDEAIQHQQSIKKQATTNLYNSVATLRNSRDTIIENILITKIDTIIKHETDTIYKKFEVEKPIYKTIVRNIYVGNMFTQKNNLKTDTL